MRSYFNHAARHHPTRGSDPIDGITIPDIAYYEISGVASGSFPGIVAYTMSLASTTDASIFDVDGSSYARINATGHYEAYAFLDFGAIETFTQSGAQPTTFRFGLDFFSFPFYTVGGPWKTRAIGSAGSIMVYDIEVSGRFVMTAEPRSVRLFAEGPAVSPGTSESGYLVIERIREL